MRPLPLLALLPFLLLPVEAHAACTTGGPVALWRCWERSLTSSQGFTNAYRDVKLRVTFTKLGQPNRTTYAFWDGGSTFKFRMAFPVVGTWSWSTTCEAVCNASSGLVTSGTVSVIAVTPEPNPLYANGALEVNTVAPNGLRYLAHDNGTRFFWLGDTNWAGPLRANPADWTSYLANRTSRGFSVIQTALPADWMRTCGVQPTDSAGLRPFEQLSNCTPSGTIPNNCSRWNPAFWQAFDTKLQQANEAGFAVALVGLMEKVIAGCNDGQARPNIADSQIYARNVAARLAGSHVVLSPAFDTKPTPGVNPATCAASATSETCRMRFVGEAIKAATPHQLVTNHWGGSTPVADMQPFQAQAWLDFQLFQSGQAASSSTVGNQLQTITQRARELPVTLWGYLPTKPNLNGESIYDGGSDAQIGAANYNPYRTRQTAYLSLLSGAAGYTYGVQGVWDWGAFGTTPATGMARRSNEEMQHLGTLMRGLAWQTLQPQHGRIQNQVPDTQQEKKMVVATDAAAILLAYLPDNPTIQIRFASLPGVPRNGRWFNPRLGSTSAATGVQSTTDALVYTYTRPTCGGNPTCVAEPDWLLLLP